MKIIRLIHPVLGLCAQEVIRSYFNEEYIKKMWFKKYGQMLKSCTTEIFEDNPKHEKVIKNTRNGEIYENAYEASKETGLTLGHINKILCRRLEVNSDYYLVYKEKEAV